MSRLASPLGQSLFVVIGWCHTTHCRCQISLWLGVSCINSPLWGSFEASEANFLFNSTDLEAQFELWAKWVHLCSSDWLTVHSLFDLIFFFFKWEPDPKRQLAFTGSQRTHPWKAKDYIWAAGFRQNYFLLGNETTGLPCSLWVMFLCHAHLNWPRRPSLSGHWRNLESEGCRGIDLPDERQDAQLNLNSK